MNTPSGSSVNKWLSRAALTLALTAGADIGTPKEADAAPGDQVTKITNPDVYLCTTKPSIDLLRVKVFSIINDLTQPKGKDVTITGTTELEQKVSGLSQDVYGKPVTTYRNKYHVVSWPGDAKFEAGTYFIDKDTKTIALAITVNSTGTSGFDTIIEGATPAEDIAFVEGGGKAAFYGTLSDGKGGLQVPKKIKEMPLDIGDTVFHKSTMIGIKEDPNTGAATLKRFEITKDDIVEKESIYLGYGGLPNWKNIFITYKDKTGKETTYVTIQGTGPNGDEDRLYDISDLSEFKIATGYTIACPDGRFEFKWNTDNGQKVITDTWNPDPKTNASAFTAAIDPDQLTPLQGYDIPTFESFDSNGKHWLIQVTATNPLTVTITEYINTVMGGGCIPNPQPPAPIIETKPAGAETVEGAETSGADTSGAEAEVVEAVAEKETDAGPKEVIGSGDSNNGDGDATGSPETIGPNDATQPSDAVKPDDGTNPTDADDAVTQPKDIPLEPDVTAQKETDAGPTTSDNGTQPTTDAKQAADLQQIEDTADTAQQKPPSSPSPSANSGCSATPGATSTSTRSALAQLGFLMTIAAGAQMMRRRKETAQQE